MDRVYAALPSFPTVVQTTPGVPSAGAEQVVLEPMAAGTEFRALNSEEAFEQAVAAIEEQRKSAFREISRELRRGYDAEIDRWARMERIRLTAESREHIRQALREIEVAFQEYALRRGPPLVRLSFLVGFPDPDPKSQVEMPENRPFLEQKLKEAPPLRRRITVLDAEFEARTAKIMDRAQEQTELDLTRFQVEVARKRIEALEQAEGQALRLIQQSPSFSPDAAGEFRIDIQPEPPIAETLPGFPASEGVAVVLPGSLPQSVARQRVDSELNLWCAIQGYRLATPGEPAKDVTEEFIEWLTRQP
ncbi:MAG: hypothetical protein ACK4P3_01530 [Fimbriimonadaceae bacterium]